MTALLPLPYMQFLRGELDQERVHLDDVLADMRISTSPFNKVCALTCSFRPTFTFALSTSAVWLL